MNLLLSADVVTNECSVISSGWRHGRFNLGHVSIWDGQCENLNAHERPNNGDCGVNAALRGDLLMPLDACEAVYQKAATKWAMLKFILRAVADSCLLESQHPAIL